MFIIQVIIKTIKHKIIDYRVYKIDLWGISRLSAPFRKKKMKKKRQNLFRFQVAYNRREKQLFDLISNWTININKYNWPILRFTDNFLNYFSFLKFKFFKESLFSLFLKNLKIGFKNRLNKDSFIITFLKWFLITISNRRYKLNFVKIKKNNKIIKISNKFLKICKFFFKSFKNKMQYRWNRRKIYYFRTDNKFKFTKVRKMKKKFVSIRITKLFFLTLTYKQFRKLGKKAKSKDGLFEQNYLILLEGRLMSVIYRSTFLSNIFEIIRFVKKGHVNINKFYVNFPNYILNIMEFASFRNCLKGNIYWNLLLRLKKKAILFNVPNYIFCSFSFFSLFFKKFPKMGSLVYLSI